MTNCNCDKEAVDRESWQDNAEKGLSLGGKHRGPHDWHTNIFSPEYFFSVLQNTNQKTLALSFLCLVKTHECSISFLFKLRMTSLSLWSIFHYLLTQIYLQKWSLKHGWCLMKKSKGWKRMGNCREQALKNLIRTLYKTVLWKVKISETAARKIFVPRSKLKKTVSIQLFYNH